MAKKIAVDEFKKHIMESYVLDSEGTHHEFVSHMHGRKLDFDSIPENSNLFKEWVEVVATELEKLYKHVPKNKLAVLSVAGGTNRLVGPVAKTMGGGVTPLLTEKTSPKSVRLTDEAKAKLKSLKPEMVVAIEDVGTAGTTSASAVQSARQAGAKMVEALNTWQRRERLEELEKIKATYNSIIKEVLPTFSPDDCRASGYCSQSWNYIPHE